MVEVCARIPAIRHAGRARTPASYEERLLSRGPDHGPRCSAPLAKEIRFARAKSPLRRTAMATALADRTETPAQNYQTAPPGFTYDQWQRFNRDGFLMMEDAIEPGDIRRYIDATNRIAADYFTRNPG